MIEGATAAPVEGGANGREALERRARPALEAAAAGPLVQFLREAALRTTLVFASLLLSLAALELAVRLLGNTEYRFTGVIGASPWGDEPDFRDRRSGDALLAKTDGTFRVLVVGDSVTWVVAFTPRTPIRRDWRVD